MGSTDRRAWGGIAGPAAFITAWAVGGTIRSGYSPVDDAISLLAAVGASTRPLMTAGFVAFGVGVPVYATALRKAVPGPAWTMAAATGLATLGVAATPLDTSATVDATHGIFAAIGYVTLAATPVLAARPLVVAGHRTAAMASAAIGIASGLCLAGTVLGPGHGLWQRLGLSLGDAWLAATAVWLLSGERRRAVPVPPVDRHRHVWPGRRR